MGKIARADSFFLEAEDGRQEWSQELQELQNGKGASFVAGKERTELRSCRMDGGIGLGGGCGQTSALR